MANLDIILPGTDVDPSTVQPSSRKPLSLGPGLRSTRGTNVQSVSAGRLHVEPRKNSIWVESADGRYLPSVGDLVVATVHHSAAEVFHCSITPHTPFALLNQLAFEGATRKTRPNLAPGALVYARVSSLDDWGDVELECCNPATGKAEGMGPLKDGAVFNVSPSFARRLTLGPKKGGVTILEAIGERVRFEIAVGRNGLVWVDAGDVRDTVAIGQLLTKVDDSALTAVEQSKLASSWSNNR